MRAKNRNRDPKGLGCAFEGCVNGHEARGYCSAHCRQLRLGQELHALRPTDPRARMELMITRGSDGCWLWSGPLDPGGYGRTRLSARTVMAHRAMYELEVGLIPEGMELDHICHKRACVNPEHLRPVTRKQNMENRSGANSNSKSGVLGVSYVPRDGLWAANVTHNRVMHTTYHATREAAAEAVVEMRRKLYTHNELDRVSPDTVFTVLEERNHERSQ